MGIYAKLYWKPLVNILQSACGTETEAEIMLKVEAFIKSGGEYLSFKVASFFLQFWSWRRASGGLIHDTGEKSRANFPIKINRAGWNVTCKGAIETGAILLRQLLLLLRFEGAANVSRKEKSP